MAKTRMSKMIHLAQFLKPVGDEQNIDNTRGDVTLSYAPDFQAYISIDPLSGSEIWRAQQMQANVTHRIGIQTNAKLTNRHKFTWNGRTFTVGPPWGEEAERGYFQAFLAAEVRG